MLSRKFVAEQEAIGVKESLKGRSGTNHKKLRTTGLAETEKNCVDVFTAQCTVAHPLWTPHVL